MKLSLNNVETARTDSFTYPNCEFINFGTNKLLPTTNKEIQCLLLNVNKIKLLARGCHQLSLMLGVNGLC